MENCTIESLAEYFDAPLLDTGFEIECRDAFRIAVQVHSENELNLLLFQDVNLVMSLSSTLRNVRKDLAFLADTMFDFREGVKHG